MRGNPDKMRAFCDHINKLARKGFSGLYVAVFFWLKRFSADKDCAANVLSPSGNKLTDPLARVRPVNHPVTETIHSDALQLRRSNLYEGELTAFG